MDIEKVNTLTHFLGEILQTPNQNRVKNISMEVHNNYVNIVTWNMKAPKGSLAAFTYTLYFREFEGSNSDFHKAIGSAVQEAQDTLARILGE